MKRWWSASLALWLAVAVRGDTLPEVNNTRLTSGTNAPTTNSSCSVWMEWRPPRVAPAVIMQVVTHDYMLIQRNFIKVMEANTGFTRHNLLLLCLDEESVETVAKLGFRCVPVRDADERNFAYIWKIRVELLACLLDMGLDVILSDSDALWLRDPMEDFIRPEVRGSDVVASRGSYPRVLANGWGATMCMGFVLFRATGSRILSFVRAMELVVLRDGDDQVAINYAAKELGIEWDKSTDMTYTSSTHFGRGVIRDVDGADLHVVLLPHDKYTRRCEDVPLSDKVVVAHCRSKKHGHSKTVWMNEAGLWLVNEEMDRAGENTLQILSTDAEDSAP